MITRNPKSKNQLFTIRQQLTDALFFLKQKAESGTDTRQDRVKMRHIVPALSGKIYADLVVESYMVNGTAY